jgi:GNAT superfamily N-acetyltransferase
MISARVAELMTTCRFRPAALTDIPTVVALVESAYRGDASRIGWTTEADLLDGQRTDADDVRTAIDRERSVVLLAEQDRRLVPRRGLPRVVACAHVADEAGAGYFGMFAVIPALQGGGVGKAVLAEAERIARDDWQLSAMRMTVIDVRAELIAFYERRGYARTGATKPFPYGDPRFGLPRRDDLRFAVLEKPL